MISKMNIIDIYKYVMSNPTKFSGRASRKEFWLFTLGSYLVNMVISFLFVQFIKMNTNEDSSLSAPGFFFIVIFIIYFLYLLLASIALQVRRLHDTGKSGAYALLGLIPYIGVIILLVFYCTESQRGTNQYGPHPYEKDSQQNIFKDYM